MKEDLPLIVDVKRGSTDDGPGIRSVVFFKGCPLSCVWCQNPEAIDERVEIGFYPHECIGCFECESACAEGAIVRDAARRIDRLSCTRCGRCADACPGNALRKIGERFEIDDLVSLLLRDRPFYESSGGGVTLSGGEPTLWLSFCGGLLRRMRTEGIHTAVQTNGCYEHDEFALKLLPWIDLVMFDVKILDPHEHARYTGMENGRILENLARLADGAVEVVPRTPLIPDITETRENLRGIRRFLGNLGFERHELLPYNPLGFSKWKTIGVDPPAPVGF